MGTRQYADEVEGGKYFVEPHIPRFAEFERWRDKRILEIRCGFGTDTINITYDHLFGSGNISVIEGDIRDTFFPSNYYDEMSCISTLEHVGMNSDRYLAGRGSEEIAARRRDGEGWLQAVRELLRLCRPAGLVLVTVPYGISEDFGWFHVFDQHKLLRLQAVTPAQTSMCTWCFKATASGLVEIQVEDPVGSAYGGVFRSGGSAVARLEIVKKV